MSLNIYFFRKNHIDGSSIQKLIETKNLTLLDLLMASKNRSGENEIKLIKIEFLKLLKVIYPKNSVLVNTRIYKEYISFSAVNLE
jgi:hypothetical protein